jgi:Protein of unknown function (DUF2971)
MSKSKLPRWLYKYKAFNVNTLGLLSNAHVYYANPAKFNDPLDCKPTIQIDTDRSSIEKLCYKMLVAAYSKEEALLKIEGNRNLSTEDEDCECDPEREANYYMRLLASDVKELLYREFGKRGVLSLAERWDCPLMWSHYADQHRGLCIEYDTTNNECPNIMDVDYRRPRSIRVTDLVAWKVNGSADAAKAIHDAFFFSKAPQWRYEKEWRDINETSHASPAPLRISAIYFGLQCDSAVKTCIVKLYSNAARPIKFYDIYPLDDSFQLKRTLVDTDYIEACGLKSSALLDFKDLLDDRTLVLPDT